LGVNAVAVKKGPGSVAAGIRWLQELKEIAVDPEKCPCAAKELAGYEYPPAPDGGFLSEFPDRDNHMIDALRYAMEPETGRRAARTMKLYSGNDREEET
jgi:phage terminase large subunit